MEENNEEQRRFQAIEPGTAITNRYRVIKLLGYGGMGEVYQVEDSAEKRIAALKILWAQKIRCAPESRARFENEFEVAKKLAHPNLVQVLDFGVIADGSAFIVMEYLGGGTLKGRFSKANPLPFPDVLRFLHAIAGALAYMHSHGVIHRDLKPENVLFDEAGVPKLGDFGLARDVDEGMTLTALGGTVGTPEYIAPEQATRVDAMGRKITLDHRVDIYSLGVMAFELIACERPFGGDETMLMRQHVTAEMPELHVPRGKEVPDWAKRFVIPEWYRDFVTICTNKRREDRFQSMNDIVRVLEKRMRNMALLAEEPKVGFFRRLFG